MPICSQTVRMHTSAKYLAYKDQELRGNYHCKLNKSNTSWMMIVSQEPQALNLCKEDIDKSSRTKNSFEVHDTRNSTNLSTKWLKEEFNICLGDLHRTKKEVRNMSQLFEAKKQVHNGP